MGDLSYTQSGLPGEQGGSQGGGVGTGLTDLNGSLSASVTRITASATVVTIADTNYARNSLKIYNDSTSPLYLKFGLDCSMTDFTVALAANAYFELPPPCFLGIITGLWDGTDGGAQVTEEF